MWWPPGCVSLAQMISLDVWILYDDTRMLNRDTVYYETNCLSVLVCRPKLSNVVILAEVNQSYTALNGKQKPRPVLYYNMTLIKARLVCLWLASSHSLFILRHKTVNVVVLQLRPLISASTEIHSFIITMWLREI